MSKSFRPYGPGLQLLLPAALQEWLPGDHLLLLSKIIRPGITTNISPLWARVVWSCISLKLASQSPPLFPRTSGVETAFPGSWSPR